MKTTKQPTEQKTSPKDIRTRAGKSRAWCAAMAGVSEPTATLFEIDPSHVKSDAKRAALADVYARLETTPHTAA